MSRNRRKQPVFEEAQALNGQKIIILDPMGTEGNPYSSRTQDQPWYLHIEAVAEEAISEYYGEHERRRTSS